MKNRNPQRKLRRQDSFDIILIVCEGEKTEIKYFEALKEFYKLQQAVIIAKPNSKSDPCNIVKEAKQEIGENKERYDYVYCVVDIDSHANLKRAKTLVNQHNKSGGKQKSHLLPLVRVLSIGYFCIMKIPINPIILVHQILVKK